MDTEQLGFTYNSDGYMLTYRGQNIGGAGVNLRDSRRRRNGAMVQADLREYRKGAERELAALKHGGGQKHIRDVIERIDATAAA